MNTSEEYYKLSIFIPYLKATIKQLNNRFNDHRELREVVSAFKS